MRTTPAIFFAVILCTFPGFAGAQSTRPPMSATKCPKGTSTEVTGPKSMLFTKDTKPDVAKNFLQSAIHCPNACYDLVAKMTLTYTGLQVDVTATNKCKSSTEAPNGPSQSPKRGCVKGEQEPQITIMTKDVYSDFIGFNIKDQTINKSRCDADTLDKSVDNFFGGLKAVQSNPKGAEKEMMAALDRLRTGSDPRPAPATPLGAEQEALKNALVAQNVEPTRAEMLVRSRPAEAAEFIAAVGSGDKDRIEKASQTIHVDYDLQTGQVKMAPPPAQETGQTAPGGTPTGGNNQQTGFNPLGTSQTVGVPSQQNTPGGYAGDMQSVYDARQEYATQSGSSGSPFSGIMSFMSGFLRGSGLMNGSTNSQPRLNQQTSGSTASLQGTQLSTSYVPQPAISSEPVASISAAPSQVAFEAVVNLAWTSYGMKTDPPCAVVLVSKNTNRTVARGNTGNASPVTQETGENIAYLRCVTLLGTAVEKSATVQVI